MGPLYGFESPIGSSGALGPEEKMQVDLILSPNQAEQSGRPVYVKIAQLDSCRSVDFEPILPVCQKDYLTCYLSAVTANA